MRDGGYLLKVLGVSGVPKLVTFALSLTTIPIVLRNVGATQYGTYLYVVAAVAICEVLIDFGISSAAGKRLAELRATQPGDLRREILAWARLQASFVVVGFVPMVLAAQVALANGNTESPGGLLAIVAATIGLNVVLNFLRPCLQSMLAFRSLSVLDTFESVMRSLGQLAAAQFMPSALGLAMAALITSAASGTLAVVLMTRCLRDLGPASSATPAGTRDSAATKARLRDSVAFLWLRISTRLFQELPLLLIGRTVGPELVGLIGAFRRVTEILSTPYLIVGNALMVRVNEIRQRGEEAMAALWEAALRIVSTALYLAALCHLAAEALGAALLPQDAGAPQAFRVLSPLVLTAALIGVLAPISDYLGALARRNIVLSAMALVQVPVLWLSIRCWGTGGALGAYVATHVTLAVAYFVLAHRTFFGARAWRVRHEIVAFGVSCGAALVATWLFDRSMGSWLWSDASSPASLHTVQRLAVFSLLVGVGLAAGRGWLRYYFRRDFLDFTR